MPTEKDVDSVTGYLQSDHMRLDGIMRKCRFLAESADMKGAASLFGEFRMGLERHIRIEEDLLFPEFEAATGTERSAGPTGVMRAEHAEIRRLLDLMGGVFDTGDPSPGEFLALGTTLVETLRVHNGKEEQVLYPTTDTMMPPPRLRELVKKMREF